MSAIETSMGWQRIEAWATRSRSISRMSCDFTERLSSCIVRRHSLFSGTLRVRRRGKGRQLDARSTCYVQDALEMRERADMRPVLSEK
jgi:hypothetical protein